MVDSLKGEQNPSHTFDKLVGEGCRALERASESDNRQILALAGIGYALLAHATALREQSLSANEVPRAERTTVPFQK